MIWGRVSFLVVFFMLLGAPVFAGDMAAPDGQSSVRAYDDYLKIRYMPSRPGHFAAEPVVELVGKAQTIEVRASGDVMKTNAFMKNMYGRMRALREEGVLSNVTAFHQPFLRLEMSYMGDVVSFDYDAGTEDKKFDRYEKEWLALYKRGREYLLKDMDVE